MNPHRKQEVTPPDSEPRKGHTGASLSAAGQRAQEVEVSEARLPSLGLQIVGVPSPLSSCPHPHSWSPQSLAVVT